MNAFDSKLLDGKTKLHFVGIGVFLRGCYVHSIGPIFFEILAVKGLTNHSKTFKILCANY